LRSALGEAHPRYTRQVNFREGWRGYLWQGRFASVAMDEPYLLAAARYVELNPVRARLAERAGDWRWSSARAHLGGRDDALVKVAPLLALAPTGRRFWPAASAPTSTRRSAPASAPAARSVRPRSPPASSAASAAPSPAASPDPSRQTIDPAKGTQT